MTTQQTATYADNGAVKAVFKSDLEIIEQALEAVERLTHEVVNSQVEVLRDASHHILEAGGKRLRPRLTLLSFAATGGADLMQAIAPAAAVELVHTASVVHDDINDHGVVRRGRPSVNAVWGRTFALLTGDFLFTKVYELMAPFKDLNIFLAEAAVALVEGETLQASAVKENNLNSEVYFRIIGLKTAALFKSGTTIGASLAGATPREIDALGEYGYNIGLAFQIVDDILDIIGDEGKLGKTAGLDLQQGKGFASVQEDDDPMNRIKSKLLEGDRIDRARLQAMQLVQSAVEALDAIPDSPYRDELIKLAQQITAREF